MIGGQAGILGHVALADGVQLATRSGVSKSLPKGIYRGSPAVPIRQYNRQKVLLNRLDSLFEEIELLKKQIKALQPPILLEEQKS
jgi:UDP-3-O-[3-hydroxymyristoyl] glucosamine N-acyltransferase